ncbi:Ribonuclease H domain [Sesbania bispinosa]|nr:Ribonuclease H domain [Sesbania bispinosa]
MILGNGFLPIVDLILFISPGLSGIFGWQGTNLLLLLVAWVPPPHMTIALNTDGSSFGNPGEAGIGGVFRDATGTWIAWDRKYMRIKCYTDSTHAIDLISKQDITYHPLASVISDIRDLLSRGWSVSITHLLREGNEVVDRLAKKGAASGDPNLHILEIPFAELNPILLADGLGIQHMRL